MAEAALPPAGTAPGPGGASDAESAREERAPRPPKQPQAEGPRTWSLRMAHTRARARKARAAAACLAATAHTIVSGPTCRYRVKFFIENLKRKIDFPAGPGTQKNSILNEF